MIYQGLTALCIHYSIVSFAQKIYEDYRKKKICQKRENIHRQDDYGLCHAHGLLGVKVSVQDTELEAVDFHITAKAQVFQFKVFT